MEVEDVRKLWPGMSSSDDVELMLIAIANDRLDGVETQMSKGVAGATRFSNPIFAFGETTIFEFAVSEGKLEAAEMLYSDDIDLEARDKNNMTMLMSACHALYRDEDPDGNLAPQDANKVARVQKLIEWLVKLGADVNAIRDDDDTVLHRAACYCTEEIVDFLIAAGARVDWPKNDTQSAFILAARENNIGALKSLYKHGADINRPCTLPWAEGRTALGILLLERSQGYDKPDVIRYLQSIGALEWPPEN